MLSLHSVPTTLAYLPIEDAVFGGSAAGAFCPPVIARKALDEGT